MIEIRNVSFSYKEEEDAQPNIRDINLRIEAGEFVVLCGKSGCGKTTITRLLNGLIPHFYPGKLTGNVCIDGVEIAAQPLSQVARKVGSVFQNPRSQFFNVDTTSELAFGCENQNMPVEEIFERIAQVSRVFDLETLMHRSIFELSGGEKQRIACASVYAVNPEIFVLDEPSSNLDASSIEQLRKALMALKASGKTVVISEHRLHYLCGLADRFIYLDQGQLVGEYAADVFKSLPVDCRSQMGLRCLDMQETMAGKECKHPTASPRFSIRDMLCRYEKKTVLDIPRLDIPVGGIVAVVGDNGAGKSTFAGCFCGIIKHKGEVILDGQKFSAKARIAKSYMVMQDVNHQLFTESVLDELTLNIPEERVELAPGILERVGLAQHAQTHPLALSGGQKQRVVIGGAACVGKEILIYDEPTSGQDYQSMRATCALIEDAAKEALLSLVITHDLEFILGCCTDVLHICHGQVQAMYPLDEAGIGRIKAYFTAGDDCCCENA